MSGLHVCLLVVLFGHAEVEKCGEKFTVTLTTLFLTRRIVIRIESAIFFSAFSYRIL